MVRLISGGIASTYIHGLKAGDAAIFTGSLGEFVLSEEPNKAIVCVGGGSGMAPIASIIYSVYAFWSDRKCYLFFGCRTTEDIFYMDEFNELAKKHSNLKVVYALSAPLNDKNEWTGETGFIHLAVDKCYF